MSRSQHDFPRIDGLGSPVEVWRDQWGIPHIRAETQADVFAGLGYAHAQDRLWQMDMLRRRARGRWAEWRGSEAVAADRLARRLGGEAGFRRDYEALNGEAREMLDRYAAGVNAFIRAGRFPFEYGLLQEEPELWRPWDSIAVMKQISFLMGSVWLKLFRAAALPVVGPEATMALRYDDGGKDLFCIPPGAAGQRVQADLAAVQPAIVELMALAKPDLTGGGSNNWAVSGKMTATGRPALMGDPHRELDTPTIYTQAHIACDAFDAVGLTVPGVPGFPHVAHNDTVAWCVTHAFMDIHDLFLEQFRANGAEARFGDDWEPTRRRTETIEVRGGVSVSVDIVETRHGPVIAGDPGSGTGLVLRSVQFAETDTSFNCLPRMLKTGSVAALFDAVDEWGLVDHNLVAADTEGHIGHRVRAKVPRRPRANGWLPVPGWTGAHEWDGMIPSRELPRAIDPSGQRIITANNRVVSDSAELYLCTDCHPPHRASRIASRLDELSSLSIETMEPIYADILSIPALLFRDKLRALRFEGAAEGLRNGIAGWDGRMEAESTQATAYARLRLALTQIVADRSGLSGVVCTPETTLLGQTAMLTHLWWVVPTLLRENDARWLNGIGWDEALRLAAIEAASEAPARWGNVHAPVTQHPLSALFPEAASMLDTGSVTVGGDNDTVFATGLQAGEGLATRYSALARHVFDVGAWDNCRWIVFQGASGEPEHPHRSDQNEDWGRCKTVPMLYRWQTIESVAVLERLMPGA